MPTIAARQKEVFEKFSGLEDWEERYRLVIDFGRRLPDFPEEDKQEKFLVKGCQSKVWLRSRFEEGRVYLSADSDAAIVKGIIAILVEILSGATPDEILEVNTDFLDGIGLKGHLSMNRTNGLYSMLKQIKLDSMVYSQLAV